MKLEAPIPEYFEEVLIQGLLIGYINTKERKFF